MGDIIELDPEKLKKMSLRDLQALMQRVGLSTELVDSVGKAAKMLIERGAIEV